MTLESLMSVESGALLVATTAGVHAVKRVMPPGVTRAAWFRRALPVVSAGVGTMLGLTPFVWPDESMGTRALGGLIVGALGPFIAGVTKRRVPPRAP